MKTGIYPKMSNDEYHQAEGISATGINLLLDCPKKYWYRYLNPLGFEDESSCKKTGRLFHNFLLEPEKFNKNYFIVPKVRKNSKAWKELVEKSDDREIIFEEELEQIKLMKNAIYELPITDAVLKNGSIECSLFFKKKEFPDIMLRSRPDYFNDKVIVDIKTTKDASPSSFRSSIAKYGYHRQAALAIDALNSLTSNTYDTFIFFAIEKKPPYLSAAYLLDEAAIQKGREDYEKALKIYKDCVEKNEWTAYEKHLIEINLPSYAFN